MAQFEEVTSGLRLPEGPVAMADGSVIVVEIFGERLTRVRPDGTKETIAEVPGGPNGAALGTDNAIYVCNNGRCFTPIEMSGVLFPGPFSKERYIGGRIQRVDLGTGEVTDLYTECGGWPLRSPNDIAFDEHGGFYFTDHGYAEHDSRIEHLTGLYYAKADGSEIREVVFPSHFPNGVGISTDGTKLFWSESITSRVLQRDIVGPGELGPAEHGPSSCLYGFPGLQYLDSLAVDRAGNVCVATILRGGISVISPAGELVEFVETGDPLTTNICFGDDDLSIAYITLGSTGRLVKAAWPRPGAKLP